MSERTEATVGSKVLSGLPCSSCGTAYDKCTESVLIRSAACCRTCGFLSTHDERPASPPVPPEVTAALEVMAHTTGAGLLRAYAALTHRMHATETYPEEATFRAQRDLIEAEILRRMNGATA